MHMVIGAPRRASIKSGRLTKEIKSGAEPGTIGEAPRGHNLIIADLSEKGGS